MRADANLIVVDFDWIRVHLRVIATCERFNSDVVVRGIEQVEVVGYLRFAIFSKHLQALVSIDAEYAIARVWIVAIAAIRFEAKFVHAIRANAIVRVPRSVGSLVVERVEVANEVSAVDWNSNACFCDLVEQHIANDPTGSANLDFVCVVEVGGIRWVVQAFVTLRAQDVNVGEATGVRLVSDAQWAFEALIAIEVAYDDFVGWGQLMANGGQVTAFVNFVCVVEVTVTFDQRVEARDLASSRYERHTILSVGREDVGCGV